MGLDILGAMYTPIPQMMVSPKPPVIGWNPRLTNSRILIGKDQSTR